MTSTHRAKGSSWRAVFVAVLRRPRLWPVAMRQAVRFRRRRWWATRPFLPIPDAGLVRFRMVTAYGGDGSGAPVAGDVAAWLEWCRQLDSTRPAAPHSDSDRRGFDG